MCLISTTKKLFIVVVTILFFLGCTEKLLEKQKVLYLVLRAEPPTLDSALATDMESIKVIGNIMDGLTRFNKNLKV